MLAPVRTLLYPTATLVWAANIITARMRFQQWQIQLPTVALLAYATGLMAWSLRARRLPPGRWAGVVGYLFWLPLLYLTLCYDHHSLLPRLPLLFVLSMCAAVDAAGGFLGGPFLAATTLLGSLLVIDGVWPRPAPEVILEKHPSRYWRADLLLGYRPLADTAVSITCWRAGRRVYRVTCTLDALGRRHTPDEPDDFPVAHAIFMGNSCVFGENVDDDQTLPAHFAAQTSGLAVYNYGFIGWGPQQMLAVLQSGTLPSEVAQHRGMLLYGLIPDHVRRVNGSYTATAWGARFPRYILRDKALVNVGSFLSSQPRRMALFSLLRSSPSLDRVAKRIDGAWSVKPSRWGTMLSVLQRCADEYRRAFQGSFITFIWPFGDRHIQALAESLSTRGLQVIDLSARGMTPPMADQLIPYDPHPSGDYYALVARELCQAVASSHCCHRESTGEHGFAKPLRPPEPVGPP